MTNLVPLCRHHHHNVHEGGYTLVLAPDGHVEIRRPDRCRITPAREWRRPLVPAPRKAVLAEVTLDAAR
jgi:hypothetical protein